MNAIEGYVDLLGPLPDGASISNESSGNHDVVHIFSSHKVELEKAVPAEFLGLKPDGVLWISYPKRSSKVDTDITRDHGWDVLERAGYRPVAQISIDDTWSALRFRKREFVGR